MRRAPLLVLISGVISLVYGIAIGVMAIWKRIEDLIWFAIPVAILGLVLCVMWVRSALNPGTAITEQTPEELAAHQPGTWYPFAITGIALALGLWFVYWTKIRPAN